MAVRGLGRTETCIMHPDTPAVARCGRCHKPLCSECVVSTADGKFCSQACAQKVADFRKAHKKRSSTSHPIRKLVKLVVWIVIILFVLGAANKVVFKSKMPIIGPLLNKLPVVGARAGG